MSTVGYGTARKGASALRTIWFVIAVLALILVPGPVFAQDPANESTWWEARGGDAMVHLYFYWSKTCPHCREAHPFVEELPERYPWLILHSLEISENRSNAEHYSVMAQALGQESLYVPAFIFCGYMTTGYDRAETTGQALAANLESCHAWLVENKLAAVAAPAVPATEEAAAAASGVASPSTDEAAPPLAGGISEEPTTIALPLVGLLNVQGLSLPLLTLVIAGMDAFNPCAFFVLMFLLSLMVHAGSRRRMLLIGGVFVLFSGLIYFVFMAAWLNLFLVVGELVWITTLAGLVAVAIGLINIKDFFWFKQGVSLSIPERAKPGLYQRSRSLLKASSLPAMLAGTAVLAIAANSYELLCTSGFPMVYTRALTLHELPTLLFYGYLAAYNVVYVVPLLLIVLLFTLRFGARKLSEREGRVLKLLSGSMMALLGITLVVAPALLNEVTTALLLLLAAGIITAVLVWLDRHYIHREHMGHARRGS